MRHYHFDAALLQTGWAHDVTITVDGALISSVTCGAPPPGAAHIPGIAIPGMINAHSHAFQRAFAGLAERSASPADSFWTWREAMYGAARVLTPEQVRSIAAQLYSEMLSAGYTSVVEFHYLHHAPGGERYAPLSAMSAAIVDAARAAGIGLTLVPVLYQTSGFGGMPPTDGQRRFIQSVDALFELIDEVAARAPEVTLGLAIHSLRAVPPPSLEAALVRAASLGSQAPIHIHIAEQTGEVDDCLVWSGQRPVEWLLANARIDARWCLVHATHVAPSEVAAMAASGAVVALCPSTEGNLGDGFFPLAAYQAAGGRIAIGSDSHVSVDPFEELRWLEYGQRLLERRRGIAAAPGQPHPGARLYRDALAGGAAAAGGRRGTLAPGGHADLLVIDPAHPAVLAEPGDALLDALIFQSGGRAAVRRVMAGGVWRVEDGRHLADAELAAAYRAAVEPLRRSGPQAG